MNLETVKKIVKSALSLHTYHDEYYVDVHSIQHELLERLKPIKLKVNLVTPSRTNPLDLSYFCDYEKDNQKLDLQTHITADNEEEADVIKSIKTIELYSPQPFKNNDFILIVVLNKTSAYKVRCESGNCIVEPLQMNLAHLMYPQNVIGTSVFNGKTVHLLAYPQNAVIYEKQVYKDMTEMIIDVMKQAEKLLDSLKRLTVM